MAPRDDAGKPVDQTVYYDWSVGRDEVRMHAGFGEYGWTTVSGKVWRDHNFDGILNAGEEVLAGHTLAITQWFWVTDPELIEAFKADPTNFVVDEKTAAAGNANVLTREADDTPATTEDGAWIHVKTAAEKAAEAAAAEAAGDTYAGDVADVRSSFTRPDSVTAADTGVYKFEKLPSFVYLARDTETEGEGDDAVTTTSLRVLQPNDTTDTLEANEVALDELFMTAYRITLSEVAPDFALTSLHVGVNIGDKTLSDLSTITAGGAPLEGSDNDAFRPNPDGDRVIQVVEEYFDNSFDGEATFGEYDQNTNDKYGTDDRNQVAEGQKSLWRTDGYIIVAARGSHANRYNNDGTPTDAASYQYEEVYNGVRYDVPRPMFAQSGGQAGLVKIPRTSLTGRVWDDTGIKAADGTYNYATGYNGVPTGMRHCAETGCLRQQLGVPSGQRHEICRGLHAEQNAIIQAARYGINITGASIYVNTQPCIVCAKMLINAGIDEIVYQNPYPDELAMSMLEEAGMKLRVFDL